MTANKIIEKAGAILLCAAMAVLAILYAPRAYRAAQERTFAAGHTYMGMGQTKAAGERMTNEIVGDAHPGVPLKPIETDRVKSEPIEKFDRFESPATARAVDIRTVAAESLSTYNREMVAELTATGSVTVGDLTVYISQTQPKEQNEPTEPAIDWCELHMNGSDTVHVRYTYALTDAEREMIGIVAVNADFSSEEAMLGIIMVVYNRLNSDRFPDTVEKVLKAPKQFESCEKVSRYAAGRYDREKMGKLVDMVFAEGHDPFDGENVLFYSAASVPKSRIAKGLSLVARIGGTAFYKQD